MTYKMVTDSEKEVGRIAGNAGTHADLMANEVTARWRKALPKGQEIIDIRQLQLCVRDDLHRMRGEIRVIEKAHIERLEITRLDRGVRDVAIPQLRGKLIGIQRLFDGTFGTGSSTMVFGEQTVAIPRDPFALLRAANIAHGRLTDSALVLPEVQLEGVKIVPRSLAKGFEAPLVKLEQALDGLEANGPAANASLELKIQSLDDLRKQAGIAARFLEALYYLAGHPEIAKRVRLSSHRAEGAVAESTADAPTDAVPANPPEESSGATSEPDTVPDTVETEQDAARPAA